MNGRETSSSPNLMTHGRISRFGTRIDGYRRDKVGVRVVVGQEMRLKIQDQRMNDFIKLLFK